MRERIRRYSRLLILLALCLIGAVAGTFIVARQPRPTTGGPVFAADAIVYGGTLETWSARAWQWTMQFPIGHNPGQDPTGATCGARQTGQVFFLPHNLPPCTVPDNVVIFVSLVGTECSTADAPPFYGEDAADLRSCAVADTDRYAVVTAQIDGVPVANIDQLRAVTPSFTLDLPSNNILGADPGNAQAIADGYQMMVAPLSPGEHEIVVHVELADGTVLPDKVARLTVVPADEYRKPNDP